MTPEQEAAAGEVLETANLLLVKAYDMIKVMDENPEPRSVEVIGTAVLALQDAMAERKPFTFGKGSEL